MYRRRGALKSLSLVLVLILAAAFLVPAANAGTSGAPASLVDSAVQFLYKEYTQKGIDNSEYGVGSYALYVLKQAGVDVSSWVYNGQKLEDTVVDAVYKDLQNVDNIKAKTLAQDLVAVQALGRGDLVGQLLEVLKKRQTENGFDNNPLSDLSAFDLLGRAGRIDVLNAAYARDYILGQQLTVSDDVYGAWGGSWTDKEGTHYFADFMATAQAVRALHYLDPTGSDPSVRAAIYNGLAWMQKQQQADGKFVANWWEDPAIDTAEVVVTLKALGRDPAEWKSSDGKTAVDYLLENVLNPDGSFGTSGNAMDATWVLSAYNLLSTQFYINPTNVIKNIGEKQQFSAVWQDAYGNKSDVTQWAAWSVADSSIASVDNGVYKGLVTALKAGQTVVRAVYNGLTASAALTVAPSGGPGGTATTCMVGVAVVGKNGELLFGPGYVLLSKEGRWGLTALGALHATGLPYRLSDKWEGFVEEIAGQAGTGMEGWCYTVNNAMPMTSADKCQVKDGDKVIWYYSKDMSAPAPKWEDLVNKAAGAIPAEEALKSVENTLSDLQSGKASAGQAVSRLTESLEKLKESEVTEELKSKLSEAARLLVVALAKVPEKALTSQEEGEKVSIKIDGEILKDQVGALKNASQLAAKLQKIGVSEGAALVKDELVVEVPDAFAGRSELSTAFPASAGREVAEAGLTFVLREREVSLRLPAEVLKAVLGVFPDVTQVEVSVKKVDSTKAGFFEGASLVTKRAFDLEVCGVTPEGERGKPSAFPERLTIAFSLEGVDLGKLDLSKLAVYRKKKDGSWEFVGGSLSADGKSFTFETDHLSLYALAEFWKTFKDTEDHWAREAIDFLARRLIIRGVGGDRFAPDEKVTRAQFAALLVKALGIEEGQPGLPVFQDVPSDHWGRGAVEAAFKAGLVSGTGNGRFEPERWITREEMAVMLGRLLVKQGAAVKPDASQAAEALASYSDNGAISAWAREGVAACVKSGIIRGRSASELAPKGTTTRAEAVVVVKNLLHFLNRV
ncbi:MAG: DUF4430 domain-containing protein [Firmicutes bacterium]|nr:DUF4430 domain-containing protein [Bacillota bacterium]